MVLFLVYKKGSIENEMRKAEALSFFMALIYSPIWGKYAHYGGRSGCH